ncbi:hypothetical protein AAHE18_11G230300 [Arachis hypogaea]
MVSTGCDEPHCSCVTNTIVKIARARVLQQKFMQLRHLDSNFMAENIGSKIPKGMLVSFQPTLDMEINGLHLANASYIFNTALDPEICSLLLACSYILLYFLIIVIFLT